MFTMNPCLLLLLLAYLILYPGPGTSQKSQSYDPTDRILLSCGASSNETSDDQLKWEADGLSKFCPCSSHESSASIASEQDSVTQVPYMTARIFHSDFTYTFPVSPGPKFIRLHFYPATYSSLNTSTSFFNLTANKYTLLSNFSAYLTVSAIYPRVTSLKKEFIVTVWYNEDLKLTFSPSQSSFAFINGIEIVSLPNTLYAEGNDKPLTYVGVDYPFYLDNTTALETIYRLNVGGGNVLNTGDTGMLRTWIDDTDFISGNGFFVHSSRDVKIKYTEATPDYVAPPVVYSTKRTMGVDTDFNQRNNLTWLFHVDSGFHYLVRLHFCETEKFVSGENQRVFFIFITNMIAQPDADVIHWTGGNDIPVYKDYVVFIPKGSHSKQDLWLALHPNMHSAPLYANVILNGAEIFKLNKSDGNLAGLNPEVTISEEQQPGEMEQERKKRGGSSPVIAIVGGTFGCIFTLSLIVCFFAVKRKRRSKSYWFPFSYTSRSNSTTGSSSLPTHLCLRFTISEMKAATRNFAPQNIIGAGGFGNVYKGYIEGRSIPVAIKRLDSSSMQGIREFHTEIQMLSKLRHVHLVSLIGYCNEEAEMILVYEYMEQGTLRDHLYKSKNSPLPWKQRLKICIGAAKGLHYLHTGTEHTIIHRDVKSTNILLDQNFVAKVSDFGLSKIGPTTMSQTHVSTVVRGSFGYVDPEYFRRQQLTEKSDVFSFGVVLFEVLCGRPPVVSTLPKEQVSLAEWAKTSYNKGSLDQIIDPNIQGDIAPLCLKKFGEIAASCVGDQGTQRPAMGDVVGGLEFAMELQETDDKTMEGGLGISVDQEIPLLVMMKGEELITTDEADLFSGSSGLDKGSRSTISSERSGRQYDSDRFRSGAVFSEITNPQGR